jgi:hypothetical protein
VTRWQLPAAALPITLRPFGLETVVSYARRLNEANDLPPNTVLRTLGEFTFVPTCALLPLYDAALNDAALERLEILSGLAHARLLTALPGANSERYLGTLPDDRPALRLFRAYPAPACTRCVARRAATPALIYVSSWRRVCRTHRRWIQGTQLDLTPVPALLAAQHEYRQFLRAHQHLELAHATADTAMDVVRQWGHGADSAHPELTERWNGRAACLDLPFRPTHPAVALPEAVALAWILADPAWRRHAAMAERWEMYPLFREIAAKVGANPDTLEYAWLRGPLGNWLRSHREHHQHIRDRYTDGRRVKWYPRSNLPPIDHFTLATVTGSV